MSKGKHFFFNCDKPRHYAKYYNVKTYNESKDRRHEGYFIDKKGEVNK